ncbi:hypothetical protein KSP39_PZI002584 [Platanthera zijinensis]|uniref:Pentatricopeptide repeat-containing protein n=1 Tax=Platanthera zijinensis TaxID=2320716 RepID=A0AAP0GEF6_9ASPA
MNSFLLFLVEVADCSSNSLPADAFRLFHSNPSIDLIPMGSRHSADHSKALQIFGQMLHAGVQPDSITMAAVLPACSQAPTLAGLLMNNAADSSAKYLFFLFTNNVAGSTN